MGPVKLKSTVQVGQALPPTQQKRRKPTHG